MRKILFCWLGRADLIGCDDEKENGPGPIASAVTGFLYDEVVLLSNYAESEKYVAWLREKTSAVISLSNIALDDPTDFEAIYNEAVRHVEGKIQECGKDVSLTFHLSPGTPQMGAVWIILSASRFRAELIQSSRQQGVRAANLPFEIAVDYIPDLLRKRDEDLERLASGDSSGVHEFKDILHRSREMQRVIHKSQRVSMRSIPVLIEGESGTGKELLARAIHQASPRKEKAFVAVNCGAISPELIESELFGHKKGAFTGADKDRKGHFEVASGGTLFLDEVGELPLIAQVKLLRVLQEKEVTPLGSSTPVKLDVRIVAATNRSLQDEIVEGRFREDLFYRLAVAILKLPPLRKREGDLSLLTDKLLEVVNKENEQDPAYEYKEISASAKNLILQHPWPGNVRELFNTLHRASVWSSGSVITEEDMQEAILPQPRQKAGIDCVLEDDLGDGVDLPGILAKVKAHYLRLAMKTTGGHKENATKLLGVSSYQTLSNWLKQCGLE